MLHSAQARMMRRNESERTKERKIMAAGAGQAVGGSAGLFEIHRDCFTHF